MTVELHHPYEQMAELIMYGKGLPSIEAVLEQALGALRAELTEQEAARGLEGMVQAGFESGEAEGDPLQRIIDELHQELRAQTERAA